MAAVNQYCHLSCVKSDQGAENTAVARYILVTRGSERGSMIVGSLVYNHRIGKICTDMGLQNVCVIKLH